MSRPLRLLLVEDSAEDELLLLRRLAKEGYEVTHRRVERAEQLEAALAKEKWDLVISDYQLPTFSGPAALAVVQKSGIDLPFLIVSGAVSEEDAVAAMRAGAADFLFKGNLHRLAAAIDREIRDAQQRQARRDADRARARAIEALAESERKYRVLLEQLPDPVVLCRDGAVIYANRATEQLMQLRSADELVGRPPAELAIDEDRKRWAEALHGAASGKPSVADFCFRRSDGSRISVETRMAPTPGEEGAVLIVARDLTERQALNARVMQVDRMVAVGTVAAGVGHEINNPLAYVLANVEMAQRQSSALLAAAQAGPLDTAAVVEMATDLEELLKDATEGAFRIRDVVRDLKTFSRGDETHGPVDLRRVIESAMSMAKNEVRHRARLVAEFGETAATYGSASRLGQVFLNLLVNAAHAIPEGAASAHCITVRTYSDGAFVVGEVEDTGSGIPAADLERIFEPFFTTKPVGQGTGLGLAICRNIVRGMRGEILVSSTPGRGTRFTVRLPRHEDAPRATPVTSAPLAAGAARVLLVEDEALLAKAVLRTLHPPHEVVWVQNGRDALDVLARDDRFDLIISDLMMPDVSGMDLYERLKTAAPSLVPKVMFLTGGAFSPVAREFLAKNPARVFGKPFDVDELRDAVNATLAAQRGAPPQASADANRLSISERT